MQTLLAHHWHHLPNQEVITLLETDASKGLDIFEIKHRQERFGPNELTPRKGSSPVVRFLQQFNNPLIYILMASALITAILKDPLDAVVIFGVVVVNAVVGFIQESKAEQAIQALAQTMTTEANVMRAGKAVRVKAAELVPGDVVMLQSGNKVPADLRLIRSRDLQVAEAALTGESAPVEKSGEALLSPEMVIAERKNMVYASTLVTYGQGVGVVVAIGDSTEVGRISRLISEAHELQTPLTREIAAFSRILLYAILGLAVVTFTIGLWRGQPLIDTLYGAIALAVAMIPEGLPAALTVTLAIGVARMARRRAIVRKLPAVETLGSTTVICSDKTGTLTQNQMTVQEIFAGGTWYEVTGNGYAPDGQIVVRDGGPALAENRALIESLKAGLLCNDSDLIQEENRWQVQGDPTEGALIASAYKAGLAGSREQCTRSDSLPFESQHQYMATLHRTDGEALLYIKGAVEVILNQSNAALDAAGELVNVDADAVHAAANQMASQGLRVLAFARRVFPADKTSVSHEDVNCCMTFLGLQGMIDPPRAEAIQAVRACQEAGIQVKMITGDHALTAQAIAQQVGLKSAAPEVMTGSAISALSDEQLIDAADRTAVFARVSPEQKLRLVEALQARGHVVAMTGDGVNDAPALKQADIGVAMGITGTDVSKEAADMVLTDDNFATIQSAVEEGRTVFDNLTKIIVWTLPTNLGEGLVILTGLVLGTVLPILPIQILWINLATSVMLGLSLALEGSEPDIMRRPPREPRAPLLTRTLGLRTLLFSLLILGGAFGFFELELNLGSSVDVARTAAVNVVVLVEVFYLFNSRSLTQSFFKIGLFSNPWPLAGALGMIVLQLVFTYAPFMNRIFSTAPMALRDWGLMLGVGLAGFGLIELEKWYRRRSSGERTSAKRLSSGLLG